MPYSDSEPRDSAGRWTSGGEAGASEQDHRNLARAAIRPRDGDEVRKPAREILNQAVAFLHRHAAALATKARSTLASTRLTEVKPLPSGGLHFAATHEMPNGQRLQSHLQINPWNFPADSAAGKVVAALHHGLVANGVPYATPQSPVGVTFTDRHGRRGRA